MAPPIWPRVSCSWPIALIGVSGINTQPRSPLRSLTVALGIAVALSIPFVDAVLANSPPVANDKTLSVFVGSVSAITLTGTDPDGDPLTFGIATTTAIGDLGPVTSTGTTTATVLYTATTAGADSFSFTANDGTLDSAPALVSITVTVPAGGGPGAPPPLPTPTPTPPPPPPVLALPAPEELEELTPEEAVSIIEQLPPGDAASILQELDLALVNDILSQMDPELAKAVATILFPPISPIPIPSAGRWGLIALVLLVGLWLAFGLRAARRNA